LTALSADEHKALLSKSIDALNTAPPQIVQPNITNEVVVNRLRSKADEFAARGPKDSLTDLQRKYVFKSHILPDLDKALADGIITPEKYAEEFEKYTADTISSVVSGSTTKSIKPLKNATEEIVAAMKGLPKDTVSNGLFDKSAVDDWYRYMNSALDMESTLRSAHNFLRGKGVVSVVAEGAAPDAGAVPLSTAWHNLKWTNEGLETYVKESMPEVAEQLKQAADPKEYASILKETVDSLHISPAANSALKAYAETAKPGSVDGFIKLWDKWTGITKGFLTAFPSFHVRNGFGDLWQSLANGEVGMKDLYKAYKETWRHIGTGGEKASPFFSEYMKLGGNQGKSRVLDVTGVQAMSDAPSGWIGGITDPLQKKNWQTLNPLAVTGDKVNPWFAAHNKAFEFIESLGRGSHYVALRERGFSPSAAMSIVDRAHFDYSLASPLEKTLFKRIVPFAGWLRNNPPLQITRLLEKPGGWTGQAARRMGKSNDSDTYTPGFLREGVAFRTGGTSDAASFIKSAGMPIEDLARIVTHNGLPDWGRTAEKMASNLHPLLTALPEMAADKQFATGRKISDLEPLTGISSLDRIIHYSPLSRVTGEARTLVDDRKNPLQKGLNLLTGVKTGTYDLDKLHMRDLRDAIKSEVAANPMVGTYEVQAVKPQFKGMEGTPEIKSQMRKIQGLGKKIKQLNAERQARLLAESGV
jgi:hypothetical protein